MLHNRQHEKPIVTVNAICVQTSGSATDRTKSLLNRRTYVWQHTINNSWRGPIISIFAFAPGGKDRYGAFECRMRGNQNYDSCVGQYGIADRSMGFANAGNLQPRALD